MRRRAGVIQLLPQMREKVGFLHSDKKGRNSIEWDAIEPLRQAIDKRVFDYVGRHEFARSDFIQNGVISFRLSRDVIGAVLDSVSLSERAIADAADFMFANDRAKCRCEAAVVQAGFEGNEDF
jgi:CRISPR associated protein, Cas1 family